MNVNVKGNGGEKTQSKIERKEKSKMKIQHKTNSNFYTIYEYILM